MVDEQYWKNTLRPFMPYLKATYSLRRSDVEMENITPRDIKLKAIKLIAKCTIEGLPIYCFRARHGKKKRTIDPVSGAIYYSGCCPRSPEFVAPGGQCSQSCCQGKEATELNKLICKLVRDWALGYRW